MCIGSMQNYIIGHKGLWHLHSLTSSVGSEPALLAIASVGIISLEAPTMSNDPCHSGLPGDFRVLTMVLQLGSVGTSTSGQWRTPGAPSISTHCQPTASQLLNQHFGTCSIYYFFGKGRLNSPVSV